MAPETQAEQIERALKQLNVKGRLKGAPNYHIYEIGQDKRELYYTLDRVMGYFSKRHIDLNNLSEKEVGAFKTISGIFYDPEVNSYTMTMHNEDVEASQNRPLMVIYSHEKDTLILSEAEFTTQQITDHFHPIEWEEFRTDSDWEILREYIPAAQVANPRLEMYEEQRWMYDERSQRAAETLSYRIYRVYPEKRLPERILMDDVQHRMMQEYESKLRKGGNPRRWFQEMKAKLAKS